MEVWRLDRLLRIRRVRRMVGCEIKEASEKIGVFIETFSISSYEIFSYELALFSKLRCITYSQISHGVR